MCDPIFSKTVRSLEIRLNSTLSCTPHRESPRILSLASVARDDGRARPSGRRCRCPAPRRRRRVVGATSTSAAAVPLLQCGLSRGRRRPYFRPCRKKDTMVPGEREGERERERERERDCPITYLHTSTYLGVSKDLPM